LLKEAFHPTKLLPLVLLCLANLLFLKILSLTKTLFELKKKKSFFIITVLLFWLIGLVSFLITDTHTNGMVVQIKTILLCFILFTGSCFLFPTSFPTEERNLSALVLFEPLSLAYIPLPWGLILAFSLAFLSTTDRTGPQKGKSKYPPKP